ncbi:MAG: hypothetical protein NC904_08230, partial [Candidatus Omnitrophica bacterium]|nr:hypothetical protein [Candidatus Omnitrophota bacterium]
MRRKKNKERRYKKFKIDPHKFLIFFLIMVIGGICLFLIDRIISSSYFIVSHINSNDKIDEGIINFI